MRETELILIILFSFVIVIGIFFLLREVMMWYWKINMIINELKEINDKLGTIEAAFISYSNELKKERLQATNHL